MQAAEDNDYSSPIYTTTDLEVEVSDSFRFAQNYLSTCLPIATPVPSMQINMYTQELSTAEYNPPENDIRELFEQIKKADIPMIKFDKLM